MIVDSRATIGLPVFKAWATSDEYFIALIMDKL
jgi:hypothetical protein